MNEVALQLIINKSLSTTCTTQTLVCNKRHAAVAYLSRSTNLVLARGLAGSTSCPRPRVMVSRPSREDPTKFCHDHASCRGYLPHSPATLACICPPSSLFRKLLIPLVLVYSVDLQLQCQSDRSAVCPVGAAVAAAPWRLGIPGVCNVISKQKYSTQNSCARGQLVLNEASCNYCNRVSTLSRSTCHVSEGVPSGVDDLSEALAPLEPKQKACILSRR